MANTTTLDYAAVAAEFQAIHSELSEVGNCVRICNDATIRAQEKSSPLKFIEEFANVGTEAEKQCNEVSDCVEDMLSALKKYNASLDEFSHTGSGIDM